MKFKVGDIITCIDTQSYSGLHIGGNYKVIEWDPNETNYICIENDRSNPCAYEAELFKLHVEYAKSTSFFD